MAQLTQSSTSHTFSLNEQATKKIDGFFKTVSPSPNNTSYSELRQKRLSDLEESGKTLCAIGEKARLQFWEILMETYTDRFFLFGTEATQHYLTSFSKYLQEEYGVPKSSSHADTKVVKMLVSGGNSGVLTKPIENLNSYLRLFSKAPENWYKRLLDGIEDLSKYTVDDLSSYFKAIKKADESWHLVLLDDIHEIARNSTMELSKIKNPKSQEIDSVIGKSVTNLVNGYVSSGAKTDNTNVAHSEDDSSDSSAGA